MSAGASTGYVVPRYRAEGAAFHHVLHGTVPGHQIDFLYCPEVPQGALRPTHFGHLARLIKYIEPRDGAPYAFAIGNLSRDDVQYTPGHGGVAVLFALRVHGVVDHAGRDMPPYAHGVIAVDRELTYGTLLRTVTALHRHFLEREGAEDRRGDFYRTYVRTMRESPEGAADFLARAIREFDDLPAPPRSGLGWDYVADAPEGPRQIALLYEEPMEIGIIAHWASRIVAFLYRSNIKWTTVSTGREIDIAGGTTIRFVPRSEARSGLPGRSYDLDDLPEDEESLAALLFGARRRVLPPARPARGWREALAAPAPEEPAAAPSPPEPREPRDIDVDVDVNADVDVDIDVDIDFPPGPSGADEPPAGLAESGPFQGNSQEPEAAPRDGSGLSERSGLSEASEPPRVPVDDASGGAIAGREPAGGGGPRGALVEVPPPEKHAASEERGQDDAGTADTPVATRSGAGEGEGDEDEVDDAAATIPVATLPGGVRRPPLFAAAPCPAADPVLTPAFLPVEKEIAGSAVEDEESGLRPRAAGHRLLIVAALAAVAAAIVLIVAAGLNIAGKPPEDGEASDVPPSAEAPPRAAPPASAEQADDHAADSPALTSEPAPGAGRPDGGAADKGVDAGVRPTRTHGPSRKGKAPKTVTDVDRGKEVVPLPVAPEHSVF